MGKRIVVILAGLALAAGLLIWYAFFRGNRPFAGLEAGDLRAASVRLSPPDVTFTLTEAEREELAGLLQKVVTRRRDDSWREYAGQGVTYSLTLRDGTTRTVMAFSPFLVVDGVGYRTEHAPCEALNRFGNRILSERG
ncbi:hypothetical protein DWX58_04015 [Pseudoflavonifractor sp. AF19-9AC]|uniref:hypothetical protein n=1 Tax=Pseudoflavonifractor sp. AF19-9AC TaxID=2292244 RepID=UPI000E4A66B3|nr:hypothetical protein [Pseudoflavonifractor sp. AF19-9AC]RHR10567.1 hypothetical protein DWX58_04015 [Pseudoflavonifractor sp. AF19-9AC]